MTLAVRRLHQAAANRRRQRLAEELAGELEGWRVDGWGPVLCSCGPRTVGWLSMWLGVVAVGAAAAAQKEAKSQALEGIVECGAVHSAPGRVVRAHMEEKAKKQAGRGLLSNWAKAARQKKLLPGFEPGLQDSESWVLTATLQKRIEQSTSWYEARHEMAVTNGFRDFFTNPIVAVPFSPMFRFLCKFCYFNSLLIYGMQNRGRKRGFVAGKQGWDSHLRKRVARPT